MIAIVSGDVCLLIIYMLSNGWFEKCSAQVVVISCRKLVRGGVLRFQIMLYKNLIFLLKFYLYVLNYFDVLISKIIF